QTSQNPLPFSIPHTTPAKQHHFHHGVLCCFRPRTHFPDRLCQVLSLMTLQNQTANGPAAAAAPPTMQEVAEALLDFPDSAKPAWSLNAANNHVFPAAVGDPAVCCATPGTKWLARAAC